MQSPPMPDAVLASAGHAVKAHLRIEGGEEDAGIAMQVGAALQLGEAFLGQALIRRDWTAILSAGSQWQRLPALPVARIERVEGLPAEGASFALPVDGYAIDLDGEGQGWIRVTRPGAAGRMAEGANLAMIGDELLQFERAEPIGGARWRLSGLWRGRGGTEAAIGTQRAGDPFTLLDRTTLMRVDAPFALGMRVHLLGQGAGDGSGAGEAEAVLVGRSVLPLSPVHLRAETEGTGLKLRWVRRSSLGWAWQDGVDVPPGEGGEAYRLDLYRADGRLEQRETSKPEAWIEAAESVRRIEVRQIGRHGLSLPAVTVWTVDRGEERK